MDRLLRMRWCGGIWMLAALAAVGGVGCSGVATAIWVLKDGKTAPAEYAGLNNKSVAVICQGPMDIRFRHEQQAPQQLAKRVSYLLQQNLKKKTRIIDSEKIAKLTDEQDLGDFRKDDFKKLGAELNADMVVFIDLEQFSYQRGRSVHQGRAELEITVYDVTKDGPPVYTKRLNNIIFPQVMEGISVTEMSEREFLDRFIGYLAKNIGQKFYDFDPRADFANYLGDPG